MEKTTLNFLKGMGLVLAGHLIVLAVLMAGLTLIFFIGLVQLLYVIPLIIWGRTRPDLKGIIPGILVAAGLTILLNTACWGIFVGLFSGGYL
jgi:hypothetical protein